jgi:hypothetical protein
MRRGDLWHCFQNLPASPRLAGRRTADQYRDPAHAARRLHHLFQRPVMSTPDVGRQHGKTGWRILRLHRLVHLQNERVRYLVQQRPGTAAAAPADSCPSRFPPRKLKLYCELPSPTCTPRDPETRGARHRARGDTFLNRCDALEASGDLGRLGPVRSCGRAEVGDADGGPDENVHAVVVVDSGSKGTARLAGQ